MVKANQDAAIQEAQKVQTQFKTLVSKTGELAAQGHAGARMVMEELQKRGLGAAPEAPTPETKMPETKALAKERDEARQVISLRSIQSGVFGQPDLACVRYFSIPTTGKRHRRRFVC